MMAAFGGSLNSGKVTRPIHPRPWLFATRKGPVDSYTEAPWNGGNPPQNSIGGFLELGLQIGNAFFFIVHDSVQDKMHCVKFDGAKFTRQTPQNTPILSGVDAGIGATRFFWADSRGYLYVSFQWGPGGGALYRSTDEGVSWSAVAVTAQSGDYVAHMTEDELGYLYAHWYTSGAGEPVTDIIRSLDAGATFQDLTIPPIDRHIHDVYYCPHRKVLFAGTGDRGANPAYPGMLYSTDRGNTWSAWSGAWQTISIQSDEDYIYWSVEVTADGFGVVANTSGSSIFRARNPGDTPELVKELGIATYSFAWHAHRNAFGHITFYYFNGQTLSSSDRGNTWWEETSTLNAAHWEQLIGYTSWYLNGGDEWLFRYYTMYRFYPAGCVIRIDETNGVDWFNNGVTDSGFKEIPDWGIENRPCTIKLLTDYTKIYTPGSDGVSVDTNGFSFNAATGTFTATYSQNFESGTVSGADFNGVGTGTNTYNATPPAGNSSTYCLRIVRAAQTGYVQRDNIGNNVAVGDTFWMTCDIYLDTTNIAAVDELFFMTNGFVIRVEPTTEALSMRFPRDYGRSLATINTEKVTVPLQQWFHLKVACYRHSTDGWVKVWLDDKLSFYAVGMNTALDTAWTSIKWGSNLSGTLTSYYDNLVTAEMDPDIASTYVLRGARQKLLKEGITT